MLVQPKRKSYNKHPSMHRGDTWASMMAREEIECAGPPSVNHDGPVMWVAAQQFNKPIKWGTSMDSYSKEQLKRLTEDGHIITFGKRDITFEPNFNAYRATQLCSIPHEIGHYVDYCNFYEEERKNYLAAQHKKESIAATKKMHPRGEDEEDDEETEKQKGKEKEGEEEEERQENGESEKLLIGVTKQKWLNEKSSIEEHEKKEEAKEELKEEGEEEQEEKMNKTEKVTKEKKKNTKANEAEGGVAAEKEKRRKQQEDMRRMKKERDAIEQLVIPVFNAKPYIEKERFANAFADEVKAALLKKGIPFPFPRKDDAVATKDKGIRQQDFFLPSLYS